MKGGLKNVHSIVMGTLIKGFLKKIGQVQFNDGGMPNSQVHRTGATPTRYLQLLLSLPHWHLLFLVITSYEPE